VKVGYDKYYQTENLFGDPYPELIEFYAKLNKRGKLLDIGCGQGRDSIALARFGYHVTGIDYSEVGIKQLNKQAKNEGLLLEGFIENIYEFDNYQEFDYILLDSMFHFGKKEKDKESNLLRAIFQKAKIGALITICVQNNNYKTSTLKAIIKAFSFLKIFSSFETVYSFHDKESNHSSETKYLIITLQKA